MTDLVITTLGIFKTIFTYHPHPGVLRGFQPPEATDGRRQIVVARDSTHKPPEVLSSFSRSAENSVRMRKSE